MMVMSTLAIALISDVFVQPDETPRLVASLMQARSLGADLAVLPEIPLNPWSPATETPKEDDAEPPRGPRHQSLSHGSDCRRRRCNRPRSEIGTAPPHRAGL